VFGNPGGFGGSSGPEDKLLSDLISAYWINFARAGNPNGQGLPNWPAFEEKEQETLFFDKTPSARPHPNMDKIMAFDAYFAKLREDAKAKK
jgi:para-nitrobenzyl esterase